MMASKDVMGILVTNVDDYESLKKGKKEEVYRCCSCCKNVLMYLYVVCPRCKKEFYCNDKCQKKHQRRHKQICDSLKNGDYERPGLNSVFETQKLRDATIDKLVHDWKTTGRRHGFYCVFFEGDLIREKQEVELHWIGLDNPGFYEIAGTLESPDTAYSLVETCTGPASRFVMFVFVMGKTNNKSTTYTVPNIQLK